jgi:hypothetical protein
MSDLNNVPKAAERINEEFDGDAVIMAVLRDKKVGVGFTGVRGNKILLALTLLCYAEITEDHLVAYQGILTPEIRDMIGSLVSKIKDKEILDKYI